MVNFCLVSQSSREMWPNPEHSFNYQLLLPGWHRESWFCIFCLFQQWVWKNWWFQALCIWDANSRRTEFEPSKDQRIPADNPRRGWASCLSGKMGTPVVVLLLWRSGSDLRKMVGKVAEVVGPQDRQSQKGMSICYFVANAEFFVTTYVLLEGFIVRLHAWTIQ